MGIAEQTFDEQIGLGEDDLHVKETSNFDWQGYIDKGIELAGKYFDSKKPGDTIVNNQTKDNTILYVAIIGIVAIFLFKN